MEELRFAELDVEQLKKIDMLQEELGVVLIAYDKRMNTLPDEELANHDDQLS